ncbi:MAG: AAA family ATPase [Chloroflexi bacterium]|nr:AAA family ATPase [Chloroflexota bacterium]
MAADSYPEPQTRFVGRMRELTEIATLLDNPDCRLLTLVGTGGIGKTRLALEIASRTAPLYADGLYFVPLQPLHEVDQILAAIVEALPLQPDSNDDLRRRLLHYLRDKHLLLILDNFEHLLDGVGS